MRAQLAPEPFETIRLRAGVVDVQTRQLRGSGGATVILTTREIALLSRLALAPGEIVSAELLLEEVWGRRWSGEPTELGVVRNSIFKLRQKVERNLTAPEHILTVQGEGYRFVPLLVGVETQPPARAPTPTLLVNAHLPDVNEPWESAWDVGRQDEERRAREALSRPGRPLLLLAPWRGGKTWMLRRLLSRVEPGDAVARLDPRAMPPETLADPTELVGFLALIIADALGMPEDEVERAIACRGPAAWRFRRWLERTALPAASGRLILAIEDLDRLARAPVFGELMALLRSQADETRPDWERLRMVYTSRVSAPRLTAGLASSPFNLGVTVALGDLDLSDLQELVRRAGLRDRGGAAARLIEAVGGQPLLLRLALSWAAATANDLGAVLEPGALTQALTPAVSELELRLSARPELREALKQVYENPDIALAERALDPLIELGLVQAERRPYRLRSPALAALLR